MSELLLDASALLAYLQAEPGKEIVEPSLPKSLISSVNYAEAVSVLINKGVEAQIAVDMADGVGLRIAPLTAEEARLAGALRGRTSRFNISLADRCCLAAAMLRTLPVLTADREWLKLGLGVEVRMIR